jgi:transcriptional regulator with XRE-family HTH domain
LLDRPIIGTGISNQIRFVVRNELAKTIGQAIARWRTAHSMTQEGLAIALDVDPMTISRFERGVTLPSLLTLQKISVVFGISMAELVERPTKAADDKTKVFTALMLSLSDEEQTFFVETLQRYRLLFQRRER